MRISVPTPVPRSRTPATPSTHAQATCPPQPTRPIIQKVPTLSTPIIQKPIIDINTHFYDGKLNETIRYIFDILKTDLKTDPKTHPKNYPEYFAHLRSLFVPYSTALSITYFDMLVKSPAIDPINNLDAEYLLYICSLIAIHPKVDQKDFFEIMNIQFEDMATGFCPQGQTIRLLQLIHSFVHFLKSI